MKKCIIEDVAQLQALDKIQNAVTFFGSARLKEENEYCILASNLATKLADKGYSIISGGGGGIMQAANYGAMQSNAEHLKSFGFNIHLPFEQKANDFLEYNITFKSLAIRKMALIQKSLAFVIFPGGFGTLDELFEILTLKQLSFKKDVPIILVGQKFWQPLDEFIKTSLLGLGTISKNDELKYSISDDLDEIIRMIKEKDENSCCNEWGCG
ncbi:putative lysine decarboxylase family protein [Campylobacter subantarcticus LMG 24377]|uniref:Cytokinin riboside 5'-monophosphate phosphoribohydrolase n=2 Tax=Campylobacter subantarcticus TaxID=497724 RepID=A0A0A8H902_9BACT|nr:MULTISPECIES: TIGR00730 family Rossman fold protein [Campylobacter]EAJ1261298.1 TIGR00730 family Rossman fold protein [Campylobacter lari]AJC90145.1 putative lysine decarboxylase family protein [Campylobacter subantarcticus LMG 24374]AJC91811.1 putative lysine decarboxylase family protein [Campylobacter subantarcticus LMG 24377]EAL3939260.1 TIGR00730 family Rossman fold protein [Campylobacter lari]MPC00141.1 TIGR00730 family Rossman fold protein [Campylobacter subantarcticus]